MSRETDSNISLETAGRKGGSGHSEGGSSSSSLRDSVDGPVSRRIFTNSPASTRSGSVDHTGMVSLDGAASETADRKVGGVPSATAPGLAAKDEADSQTKANGDQLSETSSRCEDSNMQSPKSTTVTRGWHAPAPAPSQASWPMTPPTPSATSSKGAPKVAAMPAPSAAVPPQRQNPPLRKGKWTIEEEMYTSAIIREFERGMLDCAPGTTLRSYLSEKLHCDPMRITKKFAGDASIGKRVFTPCKHTAETAMEVARVRAELNDTARSFLSHLQRSNFTYGSASSGISAKSRRASASNLAAAAPAQSNGKLSGKYSSLPTSSSHGTLSSQHHRLSSTSLSTLSAGYGGRGSSNNDSTSSSGYHRRGEDIKSASSVDLRGFDSPVVVDHTGALVAPSTTSRHRSSSFDDGGAAYSSYSEIESYRGAYGSRASASKRHRKPAAHYRMLSESLQQQHGAMSRQHSGGDGESASPHHEAAKEEDSRLLLDFFVKVHERCNGDENALRKQQQQQQSSQQTGQEDNRTRKRTRASVQQEQPSVA